MITVFDIEGNNLLLNITRVHCLVLKNEYGITRYRGDHILEGIQVLIDSDLIVGHNAQAFDVPALCKVYPQVAEALLKKRIFDTIVVSRLMFSDRLEHSLKSWGISLKCHKGDFQGPWDKWTQEMEDYCEQDVIVTDLLYQYLTALELPPIAMELEHQFSAVLDKQMLHGIKFDVKKAIDLKVALEDDLTALSAEAIKEQPFVIVEETFTPKKNNSVRGYTKGETIIRRHQKPFNPTSRDQVAEYLMRRYHWQPTELTETGKAKVNGEILESLPYPEAKTFAKLFDVKKLYGQLYAGENSWLKKVSNGRIYGRINHNGAVTGRCTHANPNLAQVPRVTSFRGEEARGLFLPDGGHVLVGVDASGLELRNLAHYLYPYDKGIYTETILDGDIHTKNQRDAGLETRDQAKRFIYAFNYGAGDELLGDIISPDTTKLMKKSIGQTVRRRFLNNNPAVSYLKEALSYKVKKRGYLIGLDKRPLPVREDYRALNVLLQSAGAIVMKKATVYLWERLAEEGIAFNTAFPVLHVHDEFQMSAHPDVADKVKEIAIQSIRDAGEFFNYKCPLDGEGKIGKNWMETH